ncbi:MAG: hypothetical protein KC657_00640 [Myxococcales bacterium]|nr:hypothetical protein [Myxococcales bacterium]
MKLGTLAAFVSASAVVFACSSSTTVVPGAPPPGTDDPANPDGKPALDPDDPANQPPHSLGTITLGESHATNGGKSSPIVSVSFVPDARAAKRCVTKIGTCEMLKAPKCTLRDTSTGCDSNEYCTYDDNCGSVCKKVARCEKSCDEDEVCKVDGAGASSCVKIESFDAGPVAFSGTTTSITLYPPYKFEGQGTGAPFLAGADLKVQAQGATGAGFEKFEESFKATTFLQTKQALSKIPREKVFGTGPLPLEWQAGEDAIVVTVSGSGGAVTCKAKDADGRFDVPREAINAALGEEGGSLSLSLQRVRKDVKKDKRASGELAGVKAIPEGWVELVTTSMETTSYRGCSQKLTPCGESECVDLSSSRDHCGACGNTCAGSQLCGGGKCMSAAQACEACISAVQQPGKTCAAQSTACANDSACSALLSCLGRCTNQTCQNDCFNQNPNGQTKYEQLSSCVRNACSESCQE